MRTYMPRILFVIARLNVGGTSQYLSILVDGLRNQGYETLVATGYVQGAEVEDSVTESMSIHRIQHLGRKISFFRDLRARQELKNVISTYEPDLIYSHTFKAGALVRSIKTNKPIVHAFHGHLLTEPELVGWKTKIVIFIERILARRSRALVTVGKRVASELLAAKVGFPQQYVSIAPGVRPLLLEDKSKARQALGLEEERRPIVVWMARVTAVKAPHRVAQIAQKIPEAKFLLVGGGDLLDEIKQIVPSNLSIMGWQEATRVWSVADVAISTSENEGMPVALIEAQLAGVPVIAINVGSVGEVIKDGETGYIFDEFSNDMIQAIRNLVINESLRKSMSDKAKIWSREQFSPEKMTASHKQLFDAILGL